MALAVLLSAAFALAQSDMEKPELPEILALWTPYQESLKSVARDRDGKIDSLDRSYLANLDKRQKEAIAAGNLDDTLAIKSERERIVAHEATTDEQRKAMGLALAKLQGSYDTALKAYAVEMIKREGVLQQKYVADLEALQKRVTTSGDLDKALRVKVERERVATGLSAALREANSTRRAITCGLREAK